eukprot:6342656-Prymnesium_polylepis.1
MRPAIDGSRLACMTEQTAPIERPHSAIAVARPLSRRCVMTVARSSFSYQPREMNSPSDMPQPAKSNAKTEAPLASTPASTCSASARHDALPCM